MADSYGPLNYPSFPQPEDPSVKLWGYMDLPKLIALLSDRRLYFPRLDCLGDPYEGSSPHVMAAGRDAALRSVGVAETQIHAIRERRSKARYTNFVSCWRLGEDESEAMWRLCCPGGQGVAIQTTYAKLAEWVVNLQTPNWQVYMGCVNYIDYSTDQFDSSNSFNYAMHKHRAFEHEREVRIICWDLQAAQRPEKDRLVGIPLDFPNEEIVHEVYVHPYAPEWFSKVVASVLRAFAPSLAERVRWSQMRAHPAYY